MKIITQHVWPPVPACQFDWAAVTDNYEPGDPIGYGATEEAAEADLREQLVDEGERYLDGRDVQRMIGGVLPKC
jgi:hypothetical protein